MQFLTKLRMREIYPVGSYGASTIIRQLTASPGHSRRWTHHPPEAHDNQEEHQEAERDHGGAVVRLQILDCVRCHQVLEKLVAALFDLFENPVGTREREKRDDFPRDRAAGNVTCREQYARARVRLRFGRLAA